jgi:uroporphyrinogen decarboxylase
VCETVKQVRSKLMHEGLTKTALIGFSGSPWTLACYMIEGGGSRDFTQAKLWAYSDPGAFGDLIDILTQAVIDYCLAQIDAGAEAIQLFDSWAGVLDQTLFSRWVIRPTRMIVEALKEHHPDIPVIGFPRGAGRMALDYLQNTKISALSLDSQTAPKWAATVFQPIAPVQGNLDPVCLLAGGMAMEGAVEDILTHLGRGPFVFNLGHGVIKDTPPQHVTDLVTMVRTWSY